MNIVTLLDCAAKANATRPKEYVRLDGLPENHNGKILKTHLRELYAQRVKRRVVTHVQWCAPVRGMRHTRNVPTRKSKNGPAARCFQAWPCLVI